MSDWKTRLRERLEPILMKDDPRPELSAYREMPLCIFLYDPSAEFAMRQELSLLTTRLEQQRGKRILNVSLMDCLKEAIASCASVETLVQSEAALGEGG